MHKNLLAIAAVGFANVNAIALQEKTLKGLKVLDSEPTPILDGRWAGNYTRNNAKPLVVSESSSS